MLFLITAKHTAETCPIGVVRPDPDFTTKLLGASAEGGDGERVKLLQGYASAPEHTLWFVVEADSLQAVNAFCLPLMHIGAVSLSPVLTIEDQVAWMKGQTQKSYSSRW